MRTGVFPASPWFLTLVNPGFNGSDGVDKFELWRDFTP